MPISGIENKRIVTAPAVCVIGTALPVKGIRCGSSVQTVIARRPGRFLRNDVLPSPNRAIGEMHSLHTVNVRTVQLIFELYLITVDGVRKVDICAERAGHSDVA